MAPKAPGGAPTVPVVASHNCRERRQVMDFRAGAGIFLSNSVEKIAIAAARRLAGRVRFRHIVAARYRDP
jgi:hypothetical protein